MKNIIKSGLLSLFLILLISSASLAQKTYYDLFLEAGNEPKLTQQEVEALKLVAQWQNVGTKTTPISQAADGSIQFIFGASQPTVLCAIMQITDIQLEPGETVYSVHLGDTARWSVEPAITGTNQGEIQHLIIKPRDIGLQTSLVVTTSRRSYHMLLKSSGASFYPHVSFVYPEIALAKFNALQGYKNEQRERSFLPEQGAYLDNLDFNYKISGSASWKPVRVYNDSVKTIIEMPESAKNSEAPALIVVRKEGGWFSDDETVMVNYRLQNGRYIVDNVFNKAYLIIGAGSSQTKVVIEREGAN